MGTRTGRMGGQRASEKEERWLNVNSYKSLASWEKRGGWGKVMMISRGVEISIAGSVGEMVHDHVMVTFFFFFSFFVIMCSLF